MQMYLLFFSLSLIYRKYFCHLKVYTYFGISGPWWGGGMHFGGLISERMAEAGPVGHAITLSTLLLSLALYRSIAQPPRNRFLGNYEEGGIKGKGGHVEPSVWCPTVGPTVQAWALFASEHNQGIFFFKFYSFLRVGVGTKSDLVKS